jgi:glucosamine kinase
MHPSLGITTRYLARQDWDFTDDRQQRPNLCDRTTCVSIFLGIDGGGSATRCVVGDDKSILGRAEAGPSNIVRVGERNARDAITAAVKLACSEAKIELSKIQRTCIGVAGSGRSATADQVRRILSDIVHGHIEVVGDMVIALEAAFGAGPGVIVIAGTGSIAYGRNASGDTARAGGWGFAISDEGSAHWIGRTVVSEAMRATDEVKKPELIKEILKTWRLETSEQMIMAANSPAAEFAQLLPSIVAAAGYQDSIARDVLTRAGRELARLARTVISRLFPQKEDVRVAIAGGVFRNAPLVRQVFYNQLRLSHPKILANETILEPVHGALQIARKGTQAGMTSAH